MGQRFRWANDSVAFHSSSGHTGHQRDGSRVGVGRLGLEALGKLGRATGAVLEGLAATVRSWGKYREDLKEEVSKLLLDEAARIMMEAT
jgi:hypothetical protein